MKINFNYNKLLLILLLQVFSSCSDDVKIKSNYNFQPGFVLTFDDNYIDEWYRIKDILKLLDARATFFVSGFNNLIDEQVSKLKIISLKEMKLLVTHLTI